MDCAGRCRGSSRLRPRSAGRNDISDDDSGRAGTCRDTRDCTRRGGTRACATFASQDCVDDSTRTGHDDAARGLTGIERLLQDRVAGQLSARLRKARGVFSIEECRLRDSSAGDRIQSVHELERSARPCGKKSSRSTVRSGGGDRQSGDTWHSRGQLRERDLSKVPHILRSVLSAGLIATRVARVRLGFWGATDKDRDPGRRAGVDASKSLIRNRASTPIQSKGGAASICLSVGFEGTANAERSGYRGLVRAAQALPGYVELACDDL
jgi:hypothetical protein